MRFTSEQRLDDGVLEREFLLGEIPGVLWTPGSASAPAPLILLGHPGGLHRMYPRLAARARHSVSEGFAAARQRVQIVTVPRMQVVVAPPTHTAPVASVVMWMLPARPTRAPWETR